MSETKSEKNGNGFWRIIAIACLSALLGMGIRAMSEPKDTVSEKELTEKVLELQQKIDAQTNEIVALRASVNQQAVDIAGIATKVGVTAHPVVAPTH